MTLTTREEEEGKKSKKEQRQHPTEEVRPVQAPLITAATEKDGLIIPVLIEKGENRKGNLREIEAENDGQEVKTGSKGGEKRIEGDVQVQTPLTAQGPGPAVQPMRKWKRRNRKKS